MLRVVVPLAAQLVLVALCVGVWSRLRRDGLDAVCQWLVASVTVDAAAQVWRLVVAAPHPAGVVWFVHLTCSYLLLYLAQRLTDREWTGQGLIGCFRSETALAKSDYHEEERKGC